MKVLNKPREKKEKIKKKGIIKPKKEQVLIVAQEIKFARLLSGNEKKTRDRVLKSLKKWIGNCYMKGYEFKEDDFIRVWKGLFYAVWMSDKPLVQEDLCEQISGVLDLFPEQHLNHALLMYKAGLRVLATEWYGLDQHRTDKFLMLVRRYLRASLRCLSRCNWSLKSCQMYANTLAGTDGILAVKTPHYARNATSMLLHVLDCYLEEIAKVSNGDIPEASLVELLRPICTYMCSGESHLLCTACRRVLTALVRQSDKGLQYQHATAAWQKMGCPEGGPEALELVSDDEDNDDEQNDDDYADEDDDSGTKPLDPRAGRVNVELPSLPVPAKQLSDMLRGMLAKASAARYKRVKICLERFEQLSAGEYPLRVSHTTLEDDADSTPKVSHKKAAQSLHTLEKKLIAATDELALRGLSRKHRKRLLAKSRSGGSIIDEVEACRQKLSAKVTNDGWQVEPTEPAAKKPKTANKDDKKRKNNIKRKLPSFCEKKVDVKVNGDVTMSHNDDAKINNKKSKEGIVRSNIDNNKKHKMVEINQNNKKGSNVERKESVLSNGVDKNNKLNKPKIENTVKVTKQDNVKSVIHAENKIEEIKNIGNKNNKLKITENSQIVTHKDVKVENKIQTDKVVRKQYGEVNKNKETILVNGNKPKILNATAKNDKTNEKVVKKPTLLTNNKVKHFQKNPKNVENSSFETPKKVKFVLKNNSMQQPVDYYKSVRQSPNIPFDSNKKPSKTNLKPSTPSPINPFFKKKMKMKK